MPKPPCPPKDWANPPMLPGVAKPEPLIPPLPQLPEAWPDGVPRFAKKPLGGTKPPLPVEVRGLTVVVAVGLKAPWPNVGVPNPPSTGAVGGNPLGANGFDIAGVCAKPAIWLNQALPSNPPRFQKDERAPMPAPVLMGMRAWASSTIAWRTACCNGVN